MAEDQMFDDLEVMLGAPTKASKPSNASAMKKMVGKRGSNSQIVPMNDLDDLEDMYSFENKRANAPKLPMAQPLPPQAAAPKIASNVPGLPPMAAKNPKHVLNAGLLDDIDNDLDDNDFTSH